MHHTQIIQLRRDLGLTQGKFWSRIGVTQSGGSRYEQGRRIPPQVLELLRIVYVERIDVFSLKRQHVAKAALLDDPQGMAA